VGEHDDFVDTTTQALLRFRQGGFIQLDTDEKDEPLYFKRRAAYYSRHKMATNIDKALYQNPVGIDDAALNEEAIEIEIIDPEQVNIHAGDLDISITPTEPEFDINLAEEMDDGELQTLAGDLDGDIENDRNSRRTGRKPTSRVSSSWASSTRSVQSLGTEPVACSTR